jgi:hypothetical protein
MMMMKFTTPLTTLAAAALLLLLVVVNGEHYEIPPCQSDEKAVQIMGVEGIFCSPLCGEDGDSCPNDVPDGVTAVSSYFISSVIISVIISVSYFSSYFIK